jgi:vitamin B12 transporter
VFVLFFTAATAYSQEDSEESLATLDPMVVTATRSPMDPSQVTANISVITAEQIEQLPATTVAEVLQYVPGVYVEISGGPGSFAGDIRIQGSETRHVAVYQDNVPLQMMANPLVDLSYLPVENIARIEVYKGAASSAWGSSLGGVVNIVTKEPEKNKPFALDAKGSYGEFDTFKARGTASGTKGRFGWLVSGTHEQSDGFIEHTEYRQNALYAKIDYDIKGIGTLNFAAFGDEGKTAQPLPDYPDFWDDMEQERTYQRLAFETSPLDEMILKAELRHHKYDTRIEDVYADCRELYNDYTDELWGGSARLQWDASKIHAVSAGFDIDWGEYDWINYTQVYDTRNWALWANDTATFGALSINAGLRYDDNLNFGSQVSPSVGAVYRFAKYNALVRAQVSKGFSAPPASWVNDPVYGNPDLEAETAWNYQIGGEIQPFRYFKIDLNLFRADVDDLVAWDAESERFQNIEEVERQGVEGGLTLLSSFGLTLYFGGSYVDVFDARTDERIPDIPKLTYTASALYAGQWFSHTLIGRYVDHNSSYAETRDERFVWDYKITAKVPVPESYGRYSLFANVYDLTDSDYLYRNNRPQPGRWVEGGLQVVF